LIIKALISTFAYSYIHIYGMLYHKFDGFIFTKV